MRCKACGDETDATDRRCEQCRAIDARLKRRLPYFEGPDDLVMDTRDIVYQRLENGELRRIGRFHK